MQLIEPKIKPPLDEGFRPAVLANRNFQQQARLAGVPAVIGVERDNGEVSRFETMVLPEGHPQFGSNLPHIERIVKFLLWQRGGHTVHVGGPRQIGEYIRQDYSPDGERKFDFQFMGTQASSGWGCPRPAMSSWSPQPITWFPPGSS